MNKDEVSVIMAPEKLEVLLCDANYMRTVYYVLDKYGVDKCKCIIYTYIFFRSDHGRELLSSSRDKEIGMRS